MLSGFGGLKKQDILWQDNAIRVFGKRGPYGSNKPYRIVPMTDRVRLVLEAHFMNNETIGISSRAVQKRVSRIARDSGITAKVSCHVLRHTFAVNALKRGVDLRVLQLAMGHSSLDVTQIYLSLRPEEVISGFKLR